MRSEDKICDYGSCGTAIYIAARSNPEALSFLIEAGADVNHATLRFGYTSLGVAVNFQHVNSVKILLEAGANVNHVDKFGESPLRIAVRLNNIDIARLLIESGADLNYRTSPDFAFQSGDTILMVAIDQSVFRKSTDLLQLLLKSGANPNIGNEMKYDDYCELRGGCGWRGYTPLTYAAKHGYGNIVSLLLRYGADTNLSRTDGVTALQLALKYKHPKTTAIIKKYIDTPTN